jgi:integrase/recombinase XerD
MSNVERFRNELAARLNLPPEELKNVLTAFDMVATDYEINRRSTDLIPYGGVPEVVKVFIASKYVENLSMKTLTQYRYKLFGFFNAVCKPVELIEPSDIRIYLNDVKQKRKVSDRYLENIRIILNGFFGWLQVNDYIKSNPCAHVPKIRFQEVQREAMDNYSLEVLRWNCNTLREKALIDFLFSTGCRVSECVDANKSDINWQDRSVVVRHGKGNKMRTVYFNAESELSLRKYLESRKDDNDALFVSQRKPYNRLEKSGIETSVRRIGQRAGLEAYPHKLRHTFATCGINAGIPLNILQILMGHAKPETTLIYAQQNQTDVQRTHQKIYA